MICREVWSTYYRYSTGHHGGVLYWTSGRMSGQSNIFAFFGKRKGTQAPAATKAAAAAPPAESVKRQRTSEIGKPGQRSANAAASPPPVFTPPPARAPKAAAAAPKASGGGGGGAGTSSFKAQMESFGAENHAPGREPTTGTFLHNQIPFLTTERMDGMKRKPSHPDYDPTTLHVPNGKYDKDPKFKAMFTDMQKSWWAIKSEHFDAILVMKVAPPRAPPSLPPQQCPDWRDGGTKTTYAYCRSGSSTSSTTWTPRFVCANSA